MLSMKFNAFLLLLSLIVFLSSCNNLSLKYSDKKNCVVKYKDHCLEATDLNFITKNYNKQDSQRIADAYIKEWTLQEMLYEKALDNTLINEEELNKNLYEVKKQYVISEFLKKYIEENLDTNITNKEIIQYYQQYKDLFKLTSNIAQIFYVKLKDDDKDITEFKKLLSHANKDKKNLNNFIIEKSFSYFIEDSLWLKWEDITKEISSLKTYDINALPKGKTIEWRDGTYYYYIKIKDIKSKNDYSPIVYEKEKIKKTIVNERKKKLVNELKNQLLSESAIK